MRTSREYPPRAKWTELAGRVEEYSLTFYLLREAESSPNFHNSEPACSPSQPFAEICYSDEFGQFGRAALPLPGAVRSFTPDAVARRVSLLSAELCGTG